MSSSLKQMDVAELLELACAEKLEEKIEAPAKAAEPVAEPASV